MAEALTKEELLSELADDASYFRPELFAVYGVDKGGRPFLGWGIQISDKATVFYDPDGSTTHLSTSAVQVLRSHQLLGEAHLRWLDD